MRLAQALKALADAGTDENREVYRRHGARGELFGVGLASLDAIAASIGTNQALARKLWASGGVEARLLAPRIADKARMTETEFAGWARQLDWYVGADALAKLVSQTPHASKLALQWIGSKREWIARAGWHALALLTRDKTLTDGFFAPLVARIEKSVHAAPNRTRDAMNAALIAIGIRSAEFAKHAIAAAKRIGKVEVDHGIPTLKTPDAATYIRRARAWLEKAQAGASRKKASKKVAVEKRAPKKTAPKKTAPKKTAPKKTAPKKTAPKKTAPKKTAPKKTAPKKTASAKETAKAGKKTEATTARAKKRGSVKRAKRSGNAAKKAAKKAPRPPAKKRR